jgi:hypothetical protein
MAVLGQHLLVNTVNDTLLIPLPSFSTAYSSPSPSQQPAVLLPVTVAKSDSTIPEVVEVETTTTAPDEDEDHIVAATAHSQDSSQSSSHECRRKGQRFVRDFVQVIYLIFLLYI